MFSYTSNENLSITELKNNVIKTLKEKKLSSAKLWYDRYRKAGGKLTFSQFKNLV